MSRFRLKPVSQQAIVITGATSGIGLVTARLAAKRGARVVLSARNELALRALVDEIEQHGGQAIHAVADVGIERDVRDIARTADDYYGGFDTWVNNAAVSIYGRLEDVPLADQRRLFETNFWGAVHGSLVAIEHLSQRGGALINVGSALSDRAIPLQGMYCAAKHALKGFTDSLRMEVEEAKKPISITLVKPAAVDTPYPKHARNYTGSAMRNPPPVYAPETVAEAILHCAAHPQRDVYVGAGARAMSIMGGLAPRLTDLVMEKLMFAFQKDSGPADQQAGDALYQPGADLEERGHYARMVNEHSLYTKATLHPVLTGALMVGAAAAATATAALLSRRR